MASKLLWVLVHPESLFSVLILLAGWADWRGQAKLARRMIMTLAATILALMFVPIDDGLTWLLQSRWKPVADSDLPEQVDGIVVLGGSTDNHASAAWGQPVIGGSAERLLAFIKLVRRYPDAQAIFLGGNGRISESPLTEADVAARVFADSGIDISRIMFEDQSRNTRENGAYGKAMAQPGPDQTWILITSAMHMNRATLVFDALQWPVLPYPVDFQSRPYFRWNLSLNGVSRLNRLGQPLHEMAGLVYYWLRGWTESVWPEKETSDAHGG